MEDLVEFNKVNKIFISDPLTDKFGLKGKWQSGNKVTLFVSPSVEEEKSAGPETTAGRFPVCLHSVQLNTEPNYSNSRKLTNESHMIFSSLQKLKAENKEESVSKSILLKFSRKYRSVLHSNFLEMRLKHEDSDEGDAYLEYQMQLYKMMELIWSLCEILFVENLPDGVVLMQLMEWCKWHFPLANELVQECLQFPDDIPPAEHPKYWDAVCALVLQGRISEVRDLLKFHPQYQTQVYDSFSSIDELLRKMPLFSYHQGQSIAEFEMKWRHWQEECTNRLHSGDFETMPKLKTICKVLCGDLEVFQELTELSGSWYCMLASYLLFTNPTIGLYDLHYHSKICIDMFGGHSQLGALDNILLAALKFDLSQVIRECCIHLSNWWLPAHLTDLLYNSELLPSNASENSMELREYLIVQYASSLSGVDSLWNVVADYLSCSGSQAENYLSLHVQRIPLTSEKKVAKVLRLCAKHNLTTEAQSICKQMAMAALRGKRLGNALLWSIKSNDSPFAMYIADQMLKEYAKTGTFTNIDVIDYLGATILMSERLTFLGKYRDFHKLYGDEKYKEAGNLLLNLLASNIAPKELWLSLLMDSLPLLDHEDLIYGVEETSTLLSCLNKLDQQNKKSDQSNDVEQYNYQQKMKHLRLALTNNLARAIVS